MFASWKAMMFLEESNFQSKKVLGLTFSLPAHILVVRSSATAETEISIYEQFSEVRSDLK